ncbi:MAG: AI-2E family transporter [Bacteroidetes bacterium]|nr:AI-2E family transporter [Bacteroidota bacterium]
MNSTTRYIAIAISILVIGALIYFFSNIVAYVLISWVLAMIGQPLMNFFQRKIHFKKYRAGRTLCAALTLLFYFGLVALLLLMFVPLVVEQASNLAEVDYGAIATALEEPMGRFQQWLEKYGLVNQAESPEQQIQDTLKGWFNPAKIGNFFGYLVSAAGNIFITLFSIIFVTFFFLREQGLFANLIVAIVPDKYEEQAKGAIQDIKNLLTRYFSGILLQMTVITLFVTICLSILGVSNALLIGFFAALINVIPYLGPIIGAAFGVFIAISSNLDLDFYTQMLPLILKVVSVFAAMQLLDNFILQPFIFSNSVLAHPLEIFIVILMGAQVAGIAGMVLAIPAYTVLRVIARAFLSQWRIVQKITEGMDKSPKR